MLTRRIKIGRNAPCPCGSGKKFKKCHWLTDPSVGTGSPVYTITNKFEDKEWDIPFTAPPDVIFDTNVWRSMTQVELGQVLRLQAKLSFRVWYSIVNYIELISHLGSEPFEIVRSWFRRMQALCGTNVLPGPEWEFLERLGLDEYLDPAWKVSTEKVSVLVKGIVEAGSIDDLINWTVEVDHYRKLRATDEKSFHDALDDLRKLMNGGKLRDKPSEVTSWFVGGLANFFLIIRPSRNKWHYRILPQEKQEQFRKAFTYGSGMLFHAHCIAVLEKTLRPQKKVDPNDLNDLLQLLLIHDNRLFVTKEKLYRKYLTLDPGVQRVISWEEFLNPVEGS